MSNPHPLDPQPRPPSGPGHGPISEAPAGKATGRHKMGVYDQAPRHGGVRPDPWSSFGTRAAGKSIGSAGLWTAVAIIVLMIAIIAIIL